MGVDEVGSRCRTWLGGRSRPGQARCESVYSQKVQTYMLESFLGIRVSRVNFCAISEMEGAWGQLVREASLAAPDGRRVVIASEV